MTKRCVCLHGHFYQPPRENPWLEEVEVQDSAAPFHDWNQRIAAECYAPNGAARIKTREDRIADIVNNYDLLSFDYGPTLLSWLQSANPSAYSKVIGADAGARERRGHGNAIACAFNHPILPLCSPRDRRTQILWGVADFKHRFGRDPLGFWLPETAANLETLRALVREGLRYTILSPFQASRVRPPNGAWQDASGARFDPTRPYRVDLGGSLSITVFFYDGPIARSFAFGSGLASGDEAVRQLESGFDATRNHDELLVVAIDGETFGHHRKGGDEALAVAFRQLSLRADIQVVNLDEALELFPAEWEAEIVEGSSWSCAHGLERWRSDCGCQTGSQPGWRQAWRAPLRESLDVLRGHLAEIFGREGGKLLADPWRARDEYIEVLLDADRSNALDFVARHANRRLEPAELTQALKLLEMQRHAQLMYTSCGWFFAEISGIETTQLLKYVARAIQLAREVSGVDLEPIFVDGLSRAPSNLPQHRDGAGVWDAFVKPAVTSLERVAAHYAIASLFDSTERQGRIFCYRFAVQSLRKDTAGPATLAAGRLQLESLITREQIDESFCVLHFGGPDFRCGLRPFADDALQEEIERTLFGHLPSLRDVLQEIDRIFLGRDYTLGDLFLDERRRLAALLLRESMRRYESVYSDIFEANRTLMELLREIDSPVPIALQVAADVALTQRTQQLARVLAEDRADLASIHSELLGVAHRAQRLGARLDLQSVKPSFEQALHSRLHHLDGPGPDPTFELVEIIDLGQRLGLPLDLSVVQNRVWELLGTEGARLDHDAVQRLAQKLWFDPSTLEARTRSCVSTPPGPQPLPIGPAHPTQH